MRLHVNISIFFLLSDIFCCRVNRRIPLMTYYIIGGIALISVFFIQLAGVLTNTEREKQKQKFRVIFCKNWPLLLFHFTL